MPKVPVDATPSPPQGQQPPSSTDPSSQLHEPNSAPSSSNKENAFPAADLQTPPRPTATAPTSSSSDERVPDSQPQSVTNEPLPSQLVLLLHSIKSTLRSLFTSKPPHTIQRLAELILYPTVHYRTLPAYLRALDRVVCVTSSADVFPLQIQASANQPNGVTNGGGSSGLLFDHAPGSDESLGGALLTPIPWLSNAVSFEDDAEPSNEGTIYPHIFFFLSKISNKIKPTAAESVSIAVHQEIHQEEQPQEPEQDQEPHQELETTITMQETTTLPTHHPPATSTVVENEALGSTASPPPGEADELPHARGPPVVGVEDMGLQDGKGVEMPLSDGEEGGGGSSSGDNNDSKDHTTEDEPAQETGDGDQKKQGTQASSSSSAEEGKKDGDGDISLSDAKGNNNESSPATEKEKEKKGDR